MYALLCQDIVIYDSALQIGIEFLPSAGENDFFSCSSRVPFLISFSAPTIYISFYFFLSAWEREKMNSQVQFL